MDLNQRQALFALSREPDCSTELLERLLAQPDWASDTALQLRVQQTILASKDIEAAITLCRRIEAMPNVAFDFNEIMACITRHATAAQAFFALTNIQLAPSALLQQAILSRGTVKEHTELRNWQLSLKNLEPRKV
mgnify:CR=1 FL=1